MGRTVTVALGQYYEDFIKSSISAGRYNNASEVIRAALRRLEEDEARFKALRSALMEGETSADVEDFDFNSFMRGLKEERKLKNG
ncbi:MAG: type II toxin-antitoxin system ParD family antitoxin [Bacteroidales bacterium]|nr:type II toxin-antitoxin system ParD family antitoxin [Bacteroidales bacterium]